MATRRAVAVGNPAAQQVMDEWLDTWKERIPERNVDWVAELERIVRSDPED